MRLNDEQQTERRTRVLDAAQRCFAQDGFHRTTMQAIAAEAGISPGAVYLYFASKEALIVGIVERHRGELEAQFATAERSADVLQALRGIGRRHFVEGKQGDMQLMLTIWAEAARSPAIAELCRQLELTVRANLRRVFEVAKARGIAAPGMDAEFAAELFQTTLQGMFKRRAMEPEFSGEAALRLAGGLIVALFQGALCPAVAPALPEVA